MGTVAGKVGGSWCKCVQCGLPFLGKEAIGRLEIASVAEGALCETVAVHCTVVLWSWGLGNDRCNTVNRDTVKTVDFSVRFDDEPRVSCSQWILGPSD